VTISPAPNGYSVHLTQKAGENSKYMDDGWLMDDDLTD